MNKKFSTLMTTGLLMVGALFSTANAKDYTAAEFTKLLKSNVLTLPDGEKDLVVNLTGNVTLDNKYVVIKQKDLVLSAEEGVSLTGRLVIAAEGVTVKGLKLVNAPVNGTGYWTKNAITVFADAAAIVDNVITQGSRESEGIVSNGIVVFPQTGKVSYVISGNTVTANYVTSDKKYGATGILIQQETTIAKKTGDPLWSGDDAEYKSTVPAISGSFDAQAIADANTFDACFADLIYAGKTVATKSVSANTDGYLFAQVTYDKTLDNSDAVVDVIASSVPGTTARVLGATLQEVAKMLNDAKTAGNSSIASSNVAVECDDAILVMGNATVPTGVDKPVIQLDGTNLYYSPVANATKLSFGQYYVLGANLTLGEAVKYKEVTTTTPAINAEVANYDKIDPDFFWTFEKVETGAAVGYAKVKNYNGKYLTDNQGNFLVVKLTKTGGNWVPVKGLDELEFVSVSNLSATSATSIDSKSSFTLGVIGTHALTASELNTIYGESFEAEILYDKKPLNGNPFIGILKTVRLNGSKAEVIKTAADSYMLMNENDSIIVMRKDDKYAEGKGVYGYKVIQMSPKDLALALVSANKASYFAYFSINAYDNFAVGQDQAVASISVKNDPADADSYYLGVLKVDGELTLAGRYYTSDELLDPTIKLGKFNKINVAKLLSKPTFFTVTNINKKGYSKNYGKILGINANSLAAYVKADEALINYPETQWAITYNESTGVLTFKNREYPYAPESYSSSFAPQYFTYNASDIYNTKDAYVFAINGDTVKIAPVAEFTPADGFERLDADKLRDQLYYVGVQSSVWDGVAYAVENHKDNHQIGLDTKKENATEWHLAAARYKEYNALNEIILNRPDTIQIGSTLGYYKADGKYYTTDVKEDGVMKQTVFLKLLSYSLKNQANNEYVRYNDAADITRYTTGKNDNTGNLTDPQYFALKIVGQNADGKNLYNLVEVNKSIFNESEEGLFNWNYKVYAGDSREKGILNRTGMYSQIENDLFVVEEKDAPEYVKLNQGDTIKIYRAETESDVLYQKGEFLGMGNAIEFKDINPALYVDTVYYNRGANNRWEYLLGINVTRVDTTYKCNVPSHGIHYADTTFGAFLVNYADSAIVEDTRNIHTNKYVYDNGFRFAKLGFEEGFRTNDTLYVARADGKFDKIEVGAPSRQLVKFAFRVMDHDANTFVIETGYKYPQDVDHSDEPATGYLRWINGNVVVTPNMEDAEVFKLKADDRNPVANEEISSSSVVVIAGEGQITVNGAAGKVVTVTNVLGQTIANSVISSNNATIAAPAGIVIVSVEGEAAVKAIVK